MLKAKNDLYMELVIHCCGLIKQNNTVRGNNNFKCVFIKSLFIIMTNILPILTLVRKLKLYGKAFLSMIIGSTRPPRDPVFTTH